MQLIDNDLIRRTKPVEYRALYHEDLFDSIQNKNHVFLRTQIKDYREDCIDVLDFLLRDKKLKGLVITFDNNIHFIVDELQNRGVNLDSLYIIDAVSIISGRGTPPVRNLVALNSPDSFDELEVYTDQILEKMKPKNSFVMVISLQNLLDYQNVDEIGMFLYTFERQMNKFRVPALIVLPNESDFSLMRVVTNNSDRFILIRKTFSKL